MAQIGLIDKVAESAYNIDAGRKGFATRGQESKGRLLFEDGISLALISFQEAQTLADLHTILLVEYTFITQELQFCDGADTDTRSSLISAIEAFDDAFICLEVVQDAGYKEADKTYPHDKDHRIKDCPKDAFHSACIAHQTRLRNVLRSPGIDMMEKNLLRLRIANMQTARNTYLEKQKIVLKRY